MERVRDFRRPPDQRGTGTGRRTAIVGARLVDGTGAAPLDDAAIVVDGDRIAWVGRASGLERRPATEIVDVSGKYIVPGLLDANVHLVVPEPEVLLRYEPGAYDELVLEAAQVALRAGVTTVFDTWGPLEALRRVRDRIAAGEAHGTRIFFAGNIIGNGGPWSADFAPYGAALNPAVVAEVNRHWTAGVGDELTWLPAEGVRRAVREYIATSGIDFVKYASSAHAHGRFLALSPDAQRAIVEEAHAAGLTAQACTQSPEALKVAIEAGVDLLQHGDITGPQPMPQATLDLIVERQLPCVAFLYSERVVAAVTAGAHLPGHWRETVVAQDVNARRLIERGATLLTAWDAGILGEDWATSPWLGLFAGLPDDPRHLGTSHVFWLRAAIERGLPPLDALMCATRNIAEAYGKLDELGTVEAGKRADLVVLDADPLADPGNYLRVAQVVQGGRFI
jgi:imidazolonepropionase-like amidohydrolase